MPLARPSRLVGIFAFVIAFTRNRAPRSAPSWGLGPPSFACARDYVLVFWVLHTKFFGGGECTPPDKEFFLGDMGTCCLTKKAVGGFVSLI